MYKMADTGAVVRLDDGTYIPAAPGNVDYQAYLAWVAAGNTPEPVDPDPVIFPCLVVRDFLAKFTPEEKLAVKAATRVSDEIGLWYDEMLAAQFITASDPDTLAGMAALVTAGLLTAARRDEILASMQPVTAAN